MSVFREDSTSAKLAALAIGETQLFPKLKTNAFSTPKRYARERMENPSADWISRTTNQGLRVTRIK